MNRENAKIMVDALIASEIGNEHIHIGIMCVIAKECGFRLERERGYGSTSVARIREIFRSKFAKMSDEEITAMKRNELAFFNHVYNGRLGNRVGTNDGYDYRGGGFNHITGRSMYQRYKPEFVSDSLAVTYSPTAAAYAAIEYFRVGLLKSALLTTRYGRTTTDEISIWWMSNINAGLGNGKNSSVVRRAYAHARAQLSEIREIYDAEKQEM